MIGITLSSEQIRRAPAEVRQWIEHEVATSLGLGSQSVEPPGSGGQLIACSHDELVAVLPLIQGVFPAVNLFFELGRPGASLGPEPLEVYRLADLQHHTRLESNEQVISCLAFIDEALHRVRGSEDGSFYVLNGEYCVIAAQTQQNIRRLWVELLGSAQIGGQAPPAPSVGSQGAAPSSSDGAAPGAAAFQGREG